MLFTQKKVKPDEGTQNDTALMQVKSVNEMTTKEGSTIAASSRRQ